MSARIFFVEDNKAVLDIFRARLARERYHVTVAANGPDAIKLLMADPDQDLIILDLMVPIMDGYKVLELIRSHPELKSVPVLVLSAKSRPEEVDRAMALGATDFIDKTQTKPDDLVARIQKHLGPETTKRSDSTKRYRLQIKDTMEDAPELARDFKLSPFFICSRCDQSLLLDLVVQDGAPLQFQGQLICPKCQT